MKSIFLLIVLISALVACSNNNFISPSNVTALQVHKYDIKALIEEDNNQKCTVLFTYHYEDKKHNSIKTNFPCDQVKYFIESNN